MSEETSSTPPPDSAARTPRKQASPGVSSTPLVLPAVPAESGRNLAVGVFLVLAALPVAGVAFIWAAREAFVAISTALLISLLVFLFFQLRLISQRNGTFVLLAAGWVVTLLVPVLVKVGASSSELAEWFLARKTPYPASEPALAGGTEPLPFTAQRPPAIPGAATGAVPTGVSIPSAEGGPRAASPPGQALASSPAVTSVVLALPDASKTSAKSVEEAGLSRGSDAASRREKAGVESPGAVSEMEETVVQRTTRLAKEEALKRYPNLGKVGSTEHSAYIQTFNEFERLHKHDFFADPKWPLNLAELLAKRHGWKKGNGEESRPAPAVSVQEDGAAREQALVASATRAQQGETQTAPNAGVAVSAGNSKGEAGGESKPEGNGAPEFIGKLFGLDLPEEDQANPNRRVVSEALAEVKRRYPSVAQVGTPENRLFIEAYQEYDRLRPDFFQNPKWPLRLVDLVAKQEGWNRAPAPGAASQER